MSDRNQVIFDFDGTIVSKNTASEFYKWRAKTSVWRVIALIALLPILIPLRSIAFFTNDRYTQKLGLNIVCFSSTVFQKTPLRELRRNFTRYYFGKCGAVAYQDAIDRIKMHQARGDRVIIVSGCPKWLVVGVLKHLGIHGVTVVGTRVRLSWCAIIITHHCHQENKPPMVAERGFDLDDCEWGYTDSYDDVHIVKRCRNVVLVNANKLVVKRMSRKVTGKLTQESWS